MSTYKYLYDINKINFKIFYNFLSYLFKCFGILLCFCAFYIISNENKLNLNIYFSILISSLLFIFCGEFYWFGKKIKNVSLKITLDKIPHKYSLYLRSFYVDKLDQRKTYSELDSVNILNNVLFVGLRTKEEQLMMVINKIAPAITVAKLKQKIPTCGAHRLSLATEDWKNEVIKLMERAEIIIIRLDNSESVLWELKKAIEIMKKNDCPERLILLLSNDYHIYRSFFKIEYIFPRGFIHINNEKFSDNNFFKILGILYFDKYWNIRISYLNYKDKYIHMQLEKIIRVAFEVIFKRLEIPFKHPGKSKKKTIYYVLRILLFVLTLVIIEFIILFISPLIIRV